MNNQYKLSPTGQFLTEMPYTIDPQETRMLKYPIGRWGRLWQEWMETEYPTEVTVLVMIGRWQIIPREIDREAELRFQELDKKYRLKNSRPESFPEVQIWEKERLLTVEHQVMKEIVFQLRE